MLPKRFYVSVVGNSGGEYAIFTALLIAAVVRLLSG